MSLSEQERERLDEALWGGCIYDDVPLVVAQIVARHVAAALEQAAIQMSGVGSHRNPCRLPDTPCLCGVCDFRQEAAAIVRAQIQN